MAKETDYKRLWRAEKAQVIILEKKLKASEDIFNEQVNLILDLQKQIDAKNPKKS